MDKNRSEWIAASPQRIVSYSSKKKIKENDFFKKG